MVHVPGPDREELFDRADEFADLVATMLGKTARTVSRQLGGIVVTAATSAERLSSVSVDDVSGITDVWLQSTLSMLVPFIGKTRTAAQTEQARLLTDTVAGLPASLPAMTSETEAAYRYLLGAQNRLVGIGNELWTNARTSLAEGLASGESVPDLAQRVRDAAGVTAPRASVIARTEVIGATNAGSIEAIRAYGIDGMTKKWIASNDARTRPSHAAADGQEVALDKTFAVGGVSADRPHDPLLPPSETVNCRCTLSYDIPGEKRLTLPADGTVAECADLLTARAKDAEPKLTAHMTDLAAKRGGRMEGLDFRLKSRDSLARKLSTKVAESGGSLTPAQAGNTMFDINRYTTVYSEANYARAAQSSLDSLRADGYTLNVKNYWNVEKNPYQGINVQITSPAGQQFELQFHTDTSLNVKEGELHRIYELQRVERDAAKREEYAQQMFDVAKKIPVPPGVETVH